MKQAQQPTHDKNEKNMYQKKQTKKFINLLKG